MIDSASQANGPIIGLIPAAGAGKRIAPLPCSKEIYPIGFWQPNGTHDRRPKAAAVYLLEQMKAAGISRAYVVLRQGKWDIPAYLGSGDLLDMRLAYLVLSSSFGTPETVDTAYPYTGDAMVAFGFPDILFDSNEGFARLLGRVAQSSAAAVLGLFPEERPDRVDMVDWSRDGSVTGILTKPQQTQLTHSWCIAVWTPEFTKFLHQFVAACRRRASQSEVSMGEVMHAAIADGLKIEAVTVSDEPYSDIGTPEGLARAIARYGDRR